jgi:hypothetical protein
MNRYIIISAMTMGLYILFNAAILEAGEPEKKGQIITQEQAAELAAKLANEKYQTTFGVSPFKPDSYQAQLVGSRWQWGKINAAISISGCSAKVEFNKDGSEPDVKVAFHTDKAPVHSIDSIRVPQGTTPQEIEEILRNMPNVQIELKGKADISKTPAD